MADASLTGRVGEGLADSIPHLGYLGASCWAMWVMLMYGGGLLSVTVESAEILVQSYVISTTFLALVSFFLAVMSSKAHRIFDSLPIMTGFALVASVGTALTLAGGSAGPSVLLYVGNAFTGLGTGCIALRCASQFAELEPRVSAIMTALMMACALVADSLFISLPYEALMVVMVLLPSMAMAFSFIRPRAPQSARGHGGRTLSLRDVATVLIILLLILLLFLLGGLVPFTLDYEVFSIRSPLCVLTALVIMAGLVVVVALMPEGFRFEKLYYGLLLALLVFYLVITVGNVRSNNLTFFFSTESITLNVVVWSFLSCVSHYAGRLSIAVFGFGRTVIALGSTLSWAIGSHTLMTSAPVFLVIVGIGVLALVLITWAIVSRRDELGARLPMFEDFDVMMGRHTEEGAHQGDAAVDTLAAVGAAEVAGAVEAAGTAGAAGVADAAGVAEVAGVAGAVGAVEPAEIPEGATPGAAVPEPPVIRPRWRLRMLLVAEEQGLTKREADVFVLLAKGKDTQSIADELCVSLSTVRTHVRNIYVKCDVHSRHEFQQFVEQRSRALEQEGA